MSQRSNGFLEPDNEFIVLNCFNSQQISVQQRTVWMWWNWRFTPWMCRWCICSKIGDGIMSIRTKVPFFNLCHEAKGGPTHYCQGLSRKEVDSDCIKILMILAGLKKKTFSYCAKWRQSAVFYMYICGRPILVHWKGCFVMPDDVLLHLSIDLHVYL